MKRLTAVLLLMFFLLPAPARSEGEEVWELVDSAGKHLTWLGIEPAAGDVYITGDNRQFSVLRVEGTRAVAQEEGTVDMPDVSWLNNDAAMPVSADGGKLIAMYCTHSDESYKPSDGTYSNDKRGSIYEIAHALGDAFQERGAEAVVSDELHHPHDAGAYRRSRQTAVQLLKQSPDALFDIHRDGIPDPEEYTVTLGGEKASKVRILVGRGNQNMEVNKRFALQVKAVGDKVYPSLIKDIYMGKGVYNQDLLPRSLLFECGTYTLDKARVLASMPRLADVVYKTMYGGVVGAAGASDTKGSAASDGDDVTQGEADTAATNGPGGEGTGLMWVAGIFIAGLILYAILSTGSAKGAAHKVGRNISEMSGGLVGKKPDKDDEHP